MWFSATKVTPICYGGRRKRIQVARADGPGKREGLQVGQAPGRWYPLTHQSGGVRAVGRPWPLGWILFSLPVSRHVTCRDENS